MTEVDVLKLAGAFVGIALFLLMSWRAPADIGPTRIRGLIELGVGIGLAILFLSMDGGQTRAWPPLDRGLWVTALSCTMIAAGTLGVSGVADVLGFSIGRRRLRAMAVATVCYGLVLLPIALWLELARGVPLLRTFFVGTGAALLALGLSRPTWLPWDPKNPLSVDRSGAFFILAVAGIGLLLFGLLVPSRFLTQ